MERVDSRNSQICCCKKAGKAEKARTTYLLSKLLSKVKQV